VCCQIEKNPTQLVLTKGGAPLKRSKKYPSTITKLSGHVDIGLIRMYAKFEREREDNDHKVIYFLHKHRIFGLLVEITSQGELGQHFNKSNHS
jgi:hypothetical protein